LIRCKKEKKEGGGRKEGRKRGKRKKKHTHFDRRKSVN
jgi:hypothetical protein